MSVLVSCQTPYETPNYVSYSFPEQKLELNQDYPEVYKPYLYSAKVYNKPVHPNLKFKPSYHETLFRPYYPVFKTSSYRDSELLYRHSHYSFNRYPTHAMYDTAYQFY
jgi:hypothetical protein